jgi:ABC transporter with metal-binding/Fe-S-binding domain ATP-binding protein
MTNACLFSGGKDSTLALHEAVRLGIGIDLLITMRSANRESYMFHYPNVGMTGLQAEALEIPHVFVETAGEKERELDDLERALSENDVRLLVTGATSSRYQADRINAIAKRLGIEHVAPLWHVEPERELREISDSFDAIITSVSAEGLGTELLGKRLDAGMAERLREASRKYGINMLFEGGEAETFVLDAPLFKKRIEVREAHVEKAGIGGVYVIDRAELRSKQ